jgi:hypothetical protein
MLNDDLAMRSDDGKSREQFRMSRILETWNLGEFRRLAYRAFNNQSAKAPSGRRRLVVLGLT